LNKIHHGYFSFRSTVKGCINPRAFTTQRMALNKVLERQAINLQSQGVTHIRIVAGFMQNLAVGVMRSGLSPLVKI
jgi:hypothetical protein